VPDPFGGSYYIENLTDQIENEAMDYIRRIDEMGGTLRAIEAGFIQNEIQNSAFEFQRGIEEGKRTIVGVNRFQTDERRSVPVFRISPENERMQIESLRELRSSRDVRRWQTSITNLETAARGTMNLMPGILAAAEASATTGEISDALRRAFGEYRDPV
jgi:methylmalonyl-CoA mutase N-terminal domain/subunit